MLTNRMDTIECGGCVEPVKMFELKKKQIQDFYLN